MRYLAATGIACLIVGSSLAYHRWVRSMVAAAPWRDAGFERVWRRGPYLLMRFWFILLPLVLLLCLGIAACLPGTRSAAIAPSAPSDDA